MTQGPARIYRIAVSESSIGSDIAFNALARIQRTAADRATQVKEQITDSLDDTCRVGLIVDDSDESSTRVRGANYGGCIDRLTTGSRAGGG